MPPPLIIAAAHTSESSSFVFREINRDFQRWLHNKEYAGIFWRTYGGYALEINESTMYVYLPLVPDGECKMCPITADMWAAVVVSANAAVAAYKKSPKDPKKISLAILDEFVA